MDPSLAANKVQRGDFNVEDDSVVISGISGTFPASDDLPMFFDNLVNKTDMTSKFESAQYPGIPDRIGKLKTWNKFDASFFGMQSRLADTMDPLGRVLLEKTYEAIVDAGINPGHLRGTNTGVFVGTCLQEAERSITLDGRDGQSLFGLSRNMLANRISYCFGIHGPSYTIDAACSSSLHALEQAYRSIKSGLCDYALVGGCNHCATIDITVKLTQLGVLCKDGYCKCFDESANGFCRAEAVVAVVLQKAKNARRIYATVVNARTNCDGFKEQGILYPNGLIQAELMKELYEECNVDPTVVDFIEAHATGTKVGDPEEVNGIETAFCLPGRSEPLKIGSVKSNMGHAEGGSGLCSLAKVILMMEHGVVLPNINFKIPRKEIEAFKRGTIKVITETIPWNATFTGINNFGYGGTNAHVLLYPHKKMKINEGQPSDDLPRLVCISGRTEEAIDVIFKELENNPLDAEFIGMLHQIHSDIVIGHVYRGHILLKKNQIKVNQSIELFSGAKRPLWFVYGGMGSQWLTMGTTLLHSIPVFARSIEKSRRLLSEKGIDLIEIITSQNPEIFDSILNAFVGITAIQIALTDVLNELEIVPDGIVGHSLGEIACAYVDGCLTAEQAMLASYYRGLASEETDLIQGSMAAIGLGYETMKDKVPVDIDIACHNGPDSCTLSGPTESVIKYVESLKSQGIFARAVNVANIAYHSRYIGNIAPKLLQYLKQVINEPKERSDKWICSSVLEFEWNTDKAKYCSADYMVNNLLSSVYFEEASRKIPPNAIVIEVGPHGLLQAILKRSLSKDVTNIPLTLKNVDNTDFFLNSIGRMYSLGVEMKLHKLYPPVDYPVSRGTRMIAPLVRWNHEKNWNVVTLKHLGKLGPAERTVFISLKNDIWKFVAGHVVDGRNLFPATGYLLLVWETISMMHAKFYPYVSIVFEDIRFHRATIVPADGDLEFVVIALKGNDNFEISESGSVVVSGRAHIPEDVKKELNVEPDSNNNNLSNLNTDDHPENLPVTDKDIYKLLRICGYNFKGLFKSIKKANSKGTVGYTRWFDNYVAFMDSMLQLKILASDTRGIFVPTGIKRLVIDADKHRSVISSLTPENPEVPVYVYENLNLIRSAGVEITGLKIDPIVRKRPAGDPVLEKYEFIPNQTKATTPAYTLDEIIRISIHLALENLPSTDNTIKTVELPNVSSVGEEPVRLITPIISKVISNIPLIQAEKIILAEAEISLLKEVDADITVEYQKELPADRSVFLIIVTDLLSRKDLMQIAQDALKDGGFILSRETKEKEDLQPELHGLSLCSRYSLEKEWILLLRKQPALSAIDPVVVKIPDDNFSWVPRIQKAIADLNRSENQKLIVYAEHDPQSGILGFFNALKREPYADNVRCFLIMDENAPSFNLNHALYKYQLGKDLAVNIYKNGSWGTYRRLPLDVHQTVRTNHIYANTLMPGDLSSLKWIEGDIDPFDDASKMRNDIIHVHYVSLNFRDVMLATGQLSPTVVAGNRLQQECLIGSEFVGKMANGKRYMGSTNSKSMTSLRWKDDSNIIWEIPNQWSLEEAATVPVAYATVLSALITVGNLRKGESILIHAGSGGVGQAAINICLHYGCEIFTTVGTPEKREFIRTTFPQIPCSHIGNSRDTSFVNMIMNETNRKGVDIVLNSLSDEKLQASFGCLARRGRFLEIGKSDIVRNNALGMEVFMKNTSFHGVMLDSYTPEQIEQLTEVFNEMIKTGAIKPLVRTVFNYNDVEGAFRYMAAGKHIGKVILKMRDEEEGGIAVSQVQVYDAVPRYSCNSSRSYIICGGLGGFGLELADWLVLRGARNIVLTSRVGIRTGYQSLKIRLWRSYGVNVVISVDDITTEEGVKNLLLTANALGPVSAIFNLAMILKDAIFENQNEELFAEVVAPKAVATKLLDRLSRLMCPRLDQFVVFSSISCGHGNAGQTNYAMANSVMERICEQRKANNLPAIAIEWGAIGDVGVVADEIEDNVDIAIGGTLPQRISSCLSVLDSLLKQPNALVSSMVVADKQFGTNRSVSLIDTIANALGLKDLKSISLNSTLAELGMDSMLSVEVKQILESDFEIFLLPKDIRSLTFGKLKEMTEKTAGATESTIEIQAQLIHEIEMSSLIRTVADEVHASLPVVRISSLVDNGSTVEVPVNEIMTTFILPGYEGNSLLMEPLAANLELQALCLQYSFEDTKDSIKELALSLYPHIRDRLSAGQSFNIIGYSYGGLLALEIVRILEAEGYRGKLCLIDSSPQYSRDLLKMIYHLDNPECEKEFQIEYLLHCLKLMLPDSVNIERSLVMHELRKKKDFNDRLDLISSLIPDKIADHFKSYMLMMIKSVYKRSEHIKSYGKDRSEQTILSTPVVLIRCKEPPIQCSEDYGLSQYFVSPVKVYHVDAEHSSILSDDKTANIIKSAIF